MAFLTYFVSFISIILVTATDLDQNEKTNYYGHDKSKEAYIDQNNPFIQLAQGDKTVDVNDFLIGVIENFRDDMKTGIPELKVPILDPFEPKKPVRVDVDDEKAVVHGNFSNIHVEGLSGFILQNLYADLQNLSLYFDLRIPHIRASGNYTLDGKLIKIIPLRGNGSFWVESKNLSLSAKASMRNTDDNHLQLSDDFDILMDFDKAELNLENFLGGGRWTEILLQILSDMSKDLFRKSLPLLKRELDSSLLKVINKHLMKLSITSIIPGSNADEYIDQILHNVQNYISKNNLDPMSLPDYVYNFTKEVAFVTFKGEAKLYDGWMAGISSIHRSDKCEVDSNRTTISVSAHLGLRDLKIHYKGHAKFMNWGPRIMAGGNVKKVAFYFKIEQSNKKGATPVLQEFEIVEMSTIWIDLSGLGPLTWIMKWMMTGISKMVENFVVEKMTDYIQEFLSNEFSKLSFPV